MRGRFVLLALVVLSLAAPHGAAASAYSHDGSFVLGGVVAVQELHQFRLDAGAGQLLSVTLAVSAPPGTDLDLMLLADGSCTSFGCGHVVAHRMDVADTVAFIEILLPSTTTYIVEVQGWVAGPGAAYTLTVALDGEAPLVEGPAAFLSVPGPGFYLHKSEDVLDDL